MKRKYLTALPEEERKKYKTEKQWMKLGYVPVSKDKGVEMYSNYHRNGLFTYFSSDDVRQATDEERAPFVAEARRKRHAIYLRDKKKRLQAEKMTEYSE